MKVSTFVFAVALALVVHTGAFAVLLAGDVDGSGALQATDVQFTVNATLGKDVGDHHCDTDWDGVQGASDVQLVINAVLGVPIDADGDGLADLAEANLGTDPNDTDSDDDGLTDGEEKLIYLTDPMKSDSDNDGLTDYEEVNTYGTDPNDSDSDDDGILDGDELGTDTDGDGLSDAQENTLGTDPYVDDSDNDGLTDGQEVNVYGSNPLDKDSDDDGLEDGPEVNTYGTDPTDADTDNDGLSDGDEVANGSDPTVADSDNDGLSDSEEINQYGSDPNNSDTDGDGINDYEEVANLGTDPTRADSDGDGLLDNIEVAGGTDPAVSDGNFIVISELLSANSNTITDLDGDYSDWIELHNTSNYTINLEGWSLTDDAAEIDKWTFPSQATIAPNGYLIVFASKKGDFTHAEWHANFNLNLDGEFLGLYNSLGELQPLGSFSPSYPEQAPNVSYGLMPDGVTYAFFDVPTPGAANGADGGPLATPARFSYPGGTFSLGFTLQLSSDEPNAEIYYTTDGTMPDDAATLYTTPIQITQTTPLRTRVYAPGMAASAIRSEYYIAIDASNAGFTSNLPICVMMTDTTQPLDPSGYYTTYAAFIEPDQTGRASILGTPSYVVRAGQRLRGSSSQNTGFFPKKQYRYEVWNEENQDKNVKLLGLPSDSDWILHAPYSDKSFMRNYITYELSNKAGLYSSRCQYFELFLTTETAPGTYETTYTGLYILMENITRGKDRVDIARLDRGDVDVDTITGGYIFKQDRADWDSPAVELDPTDPTCRRTYVNHDPKYYDLEAKQRSYLSTFLKESDDLAVSGTATTAELQQYFDFDSFANYRCLFSLVKNIDWNSTYFSKDRNGPIKWGPMWDYNYALGIYPNPVAQAYDGWVLDVFAAPDLLISSGLNLQNLPPLSSMTASQRLVSDRYFWNRWIAELFEYPDMRQTWVDRWFELRDGDLATTSIFADIDATAALITEAEARDDVIWGDLDPALYGGFPIADTFQGNVDYLKAFIQGRAAWIDTQFLARPTASPDTGHISQGTAITLTNWNGGSTKMYYTTDGSDPRLPGDAISPGAHQYTIPVPITHPTSLVARVYSPNHRFPWSAPMIATYTFDSQLADNLRVTEIMYNNGELEYIELRNFGTEALQLAFTHFTDGIEFEFPWYSMPSGSYVVIVENELAFRAQYGADPVVLGQYTGQLDNAGERIALEDGVGTLIQEFTYQDGWHIATDGAGYSLTHVNPASADLSLWSLSSGWRPSSQAGGTPGGPDFVTTPDENSVVINEVLAHSHNAAPDWIELYNTTGTAIDIGGWYLSDDELDLTKYQIPVGTVIPAYGYTVFAEDTHFGSAFALSENGDTVCLSSGSNGTLTGYREQENFGATETSRSLGRYLKSTGAYNFVRMAGQTYGAENSEPEVGPLVIHEIMYNPAIQDDEYIEILNISNSTVNLFNADGIPWQLQDGVQYTFPPGTSLAPFEFLVVAKDPGTMGTVYTGIPAGVQILGPYTGLLDNGGEKVDLVMPGDVAAGVQYYIRIDRVVYDDQAPWPVQPDGTGQSLSRIDPFAYGNDPVNWKATTPSPGR